MGSNAPAFGMLSMEEVWRVPSGRAAEGCCGHPGRGESCEQGARAGTRSYVGGRPNKVRVREEGTSRVWFGSQGEEWACPGMET